MTFTFLPLLLLSFLNLSSYAIVMCDIYKRITFWMAEHFLLGGGEFWKCFSKTS